MTFIREYDAWKYFSEGFGSFFVIHLRYDLIYSDDVAFMFNVGTIPDPSIHPIDTNKEW